MSYSEERMNQGFLGLSFKKVALGVVALAAFSTAMGSFYTVGEVERGLKYRFGKLQTQETKDLIQPGLNFKVPFIEDVKTPRIDQQQIDLEGVQTYTKDNQVITASLAIIFKLSPDQLIRIAKENPEWKQKLKTVVADNFKGALGQEEAQNVASNRPTIMKNMTIATIERVKKLYGIGIMDVQMPDFAFDKAFDVAVRDAANEKAELEKQKTVREKADVLAATKVIEANADRDAAKAAAEATAYKIEIDKKAEAAGILSTKMAEAKGIEAIKNAEAAGFKNIVSSIGKENIDTYLTTQAWKGNVPQIQAGGGNSAAMILDARTAAVVTTPALPVPAPGAK